MGLAGFRLLRLRPCVLCRLAGERAEALRETPKQVGCEARLGSPCWLHGAPPCRPVAHPSCPAHAPWLPPRPSLPPNSATPSRQRPPLRSSRPPQVLRLTKGWDVARDHVRRAVETDVQLRVYHPGA